MMKLTFGLVTLILVVSFCHHIEMALNEILSGDFIFVEILQQD